MIFIGLGANLDSPQFGSPVKTLTAALEKIHADGGCTVSRRSSWYRSAPVPPSGQPMFINAVAELETGISPTRLLSDLQAIEEAFGRVRTEPNAARVIDLDLLVYDDRVLKGPRAPVVPHPRLAERSFVLLPLQELAPDWVDPRSGLGIGALVAALPPGQECRRLDTSAAKCFSVKPLL